MVRDELFKLYEIVMADLRFHVEMEHKKALLVTGLIAAVAFVTLAGVQKFEPNSGMLPLLTGPVMIMIFAEIGAKITSASAKRSLEAMTIKIKLDHALGVAIRPYSSDGSLLWSDESYLPSDYTAQYAVARDKLARSSDWIKDQLYGGMNKNYQFLFNMYKLSGFILFGFILVRAFYPTLFTIAK